MKGPRGHLVPKMSVIFGFLLLNATKSHRVIIAAPTRTATFRNEEIYGHGILTFFYRTTIIQMFCIE